MTLFQLANDIPTQRDTLSLRAAKVETQLTQFFNGKEVGEKYSPRRGRGHQKLLC